MPLPWLIGAAVVAAAAAVAKAVSDDDSSSSPSSGEAERRQQEREAKRSRKRESLETHLANLKKNRLESARRLLARSAEALGKRPGVAVGLTVSKFESALKSKTTARSEYAKFLGSALSIDGTQGACTGHELENFLINLRIIEELYSAMQLSIVEHKDLATLREASTRVERLQHLKDKVEQLG